MIIEKEGFNYKFDSSACQTCEGNCCIGESGYIWVNNKEIKQIAEYLNMDIEMFKKEYLIKVSYKYSLKEKPHETGFACIFFDKKCTIYEVRPSQCRTFPFWDYFKDKVELLEKECPGIIKDKK